MVHRNLVLLVSCFVRRCHARILRPSPAAVGFVPAVATAAAHARHLRHHCFPLPPTAWLFNTRWIQRPPTYTSRKVNKFDRWRRLCLSSSKSDPIDISKRTIEVLSSNRRSFNRTWKRLNPLVELIVDSTFEGREFSPGKRPIVLADVGCDHGFVALSLASASMAAAANKEGQQSSSESNHFPLEVVGIDISELALENSRRSLKTLTDAIERSDIGFSSLPVEFRVGDGLTPLKSVESIAIAGMGVNTMLSICFGKGEGLSPVDRVQARELFLQPTNSRPQNLIMMYEFLQSRRWGLHDEKVVKLGGRWYINSHFKRLGDFDYPADNENKYPGHFLANDPVFDEYVSHHISWLRKDFEKPKGNLGDEDCRWLLHLRGVEKWKPQTSWYKED